MEIGKINFRTNHSIKLVMLHCDIIVHCYNFLSKDVNKRKLKYIYFYNNIAEYDKTNLQ